MKTLVTNVRLALLVLTLLGSLASCKKDSEPDPSKNDPVFVGKRWKMSSMIVSPAVDLDGDGTADPDWLVFMPECAKDDITIFKSDGTIGGEAGQVCPDEEPTSSTSTWTYDQNAKKFTIKDGSEVDVYDVVEVSSSTLTVKATAEDEGQEITVLLTWKAQ
ncbi:lipocalin family protein [Cytophagaceae bacterium DM2B3-1]|uniref:Lipocalin family protein n=1 Tax=Xanthocytophaga flava TaxID=3048013 RepID=A0ABT7CJE5_9BACT|nr:lipocalin family protein [Xanthocytophaga flavus]MDJ1467749.1 lipocalin family protein [Xanthocytophaga flavus]MDJ1493828.1 lipocalin family protein [Xanthocytophaga flavus]